MSIVISSDKHYRALANEIRNKLGTTIEYKPSEIVTAISSMQNIMNGPSNMTAGCVFNGNTGYVVGSKMYPGMFAYTALSSFEFPSNITEIPAQAFCGSNLTGELIVPNSVANIGYAAFGVTRISSADIPSAVSSIPEGLFMSCRFLKALILRNESSVCTMGSDAITNTPIADGTGYIYVPSALVSSYKAASGWSTYANQIRAIEDYPDICG